MLRTIPMRFVNTSANLSKQKILFLLIQGQLNKILNLPSITPESVLLALKCILGALLKIEVEPEENSFAQLHTQRGLPRNIITIALWTIQNLPKAAAMLMLEWTVMTTEPEA